MCRAGDVFIRLAFTFVGALTGVIAAGGQEIYIYIPWGIKEISVYRNLVLTMNSRCVNASKTPHI